MKIGKKTKIRYTKSEDDISIRDIIPTNIPATTISAIDISDLSAKEIECTIEAYNEYVEYVALQKRLILNFNEFIEHSGKPISVDTIKYRSFSTKKLEEL